MKEITSPIQLSINNMPLTTNSPIHRSLDQAIEREKTCDILYLRRKAFKYQHPVMDSYQYFLGIIPAESMETPSSLFPAQPFGTFRHLNHTNGCKRLHRGEQYRNLSTQHCDATARNSTGGSRTMVDNMAPTKHRILSIRTQTTHG